VQERRVLVVDDEEPVRFLMSSVFQSAGYKVECAKSGREALEKLVPRPDLMTLDLMMPDLNGWQVIEQLRDRANPPMVVLVSGSTDSLSSGRSLPSCVAGVVNKPFLPRELLDICDSVLKQQRRQAETAPASERRRVGRREIVMDVRVAPSVGSPMAKGKLTALSPLGAEIELTQSMSAGQTVRLAFRFPGRDRALLIDAQVQYCAPRLSQWACGLEFLNLSAPVHEELVMLLEVPAPTDARL
jgi:DNA-binding response OmpR family regulator